ncbi:unnamed protein product [Victoria cruziana]
MSSIGVATSVASRRAFVLLFSVEPLYSPICGT